MSDQHQSPQSSDPLDELTTSLLECGAVLSQMTSHMAEFDAAGKSAPDAAPISDVAHTLIHDVLGDVRKRHSKRDIRVAGAIVAEATTAIVENIFYVGPELN
jgi:hypothetical protein